MPTHMLDYAAYKRLVEELLAQNKVTGDQQSDSLVEYTRLNIHRMHRWDKTWQPDALLRKFVERVESPRKWLIITEGWCGDAAQQIPVFEHLAALNSNITTAYVLRDEHPDLMNLFLTNGSRSIPIVLCLNGSDELLWKWGPRPKAAIEMLQEWKSLGFEEPERKKELHGWYAKNKHAALSAELMKLLQSEIQMEAPSGAA